MLCSDRFWCICGDSAIVYRSSTLAGWQHFDGGWSPVCDCEQIWGDSSFRNKCKQVCWILTSWNRSGAGWERLESAWSSWYVRNKKKIIHWVIGWHIAASWCMWKWRIRSLRKCMKEVDVFLWYNIVLELYIVKEGHLMCKAWTGGVNGLLELHGYGEWHKKSETWALPNIEWDGTREKWVRNIRSNPRYTSHKVIVIVKDVIERGLKVRGGAADMYSLLRVWTSLIWHHQSSKICIQ